MSQACAEPGCHLPAVFHSYAAYELDDKGDVHPRVARYPRPQSQACIEHLGAKLADDASSQTTTGEWVVRFQP